VAPIHEEASTLATSAVERMGQICYGMELGAHYCRIVIARWEAFTGLKAEKLLKARCDSR